MLAPRSARARQLSNPVKSQGIRKRPESPSFSGSFFRTTAEQFSFRGVFVNSDIPLLVVIALASPFGFGIVLLEVVKLELKVIHISVVCCGVGFEFALRNRVLLRRCLKNKVLWWTVLIDCSLVGWTVLIEIIALKMILVVILLSRLMKSRWTYLSRNILTVLNEISDCCGLKLLDVIAKYRKIISSSSEWTLIIAMV
nr:hypothetical protein [Tanacetum cinerariifolium]